MAEFNRKKFNGRSNIKFIAGEVFRPVNTHTFVSNMGRVIQISKSGYWSEVYNFKTKKGTIQVGIREEFAYTGADRRCYQLARLVMDSFIGGYYKQRRIRYIDGDKTNCKLENLEWESGFQNGVDLVYLENLKPHLLEEGCLVVRDYLLHQKEWGLMEYIQLKKDYFKKILYEDFKNVCDWETLSENIYISAKEKIEIGRFIPLSTRCRKYKEMGYHMKADDRFLRFLRVRAFDFLNHYHPVKKFSIEKSSKREWDEFEAIGIYQDDAFFDRDAGSHGFSISERP